MSGVGGHTVTLYSPGESLSFPTKPQNERNKAEFPKEVMLAFSVPHQYILTVLSILHCTWGFLSSGRTSWERGGGGGLRVVLGTDLVRVFPLLVRALHRFTKALRDLVHKFELSFALF